MNDNRRKRLEEMSFAEARAYCEGLERRRECNYRKTKQGRFESRILSLDALSETITMDNMSILSDHGAGVEAINNCDQHDDPSFRKFQNAEEAKRWNRKREAAIMKLQRAGRGHLVPILRAICRNGNDREKSIRELAEHYARERKQCKRMNTRCRKDDI